MEEVIGAVAPVLSASSLVILDEDTQIGAARRAAVTMGHAQGLVTEALGRLAIITTEAATNMLRHADSGIMTIRALIGPPAGVEILALDRGPGIPDVKRAMGDGYSTSGTAGQGLGAILRLANQFALYSMPGIGTALFARVTKDGPPRPSRAPRPPSLDDRVGVVCVPLRGEELCGDAWRVQVHGPRTSVLVVDGLGHGAAANAVSVSAVARFMQTSHRPALESLAAIDAAIRGSRGAAITVATIDEAERHVRFAGVGNVDARVANGERTEHFAPQNGIVGHAMPTPRSPTVPWPADGRLIIHSDGISNRWRLESYPGLATAHPALIAGVIFRDFRRERDDATVMVVAPPASAP